MRLIHNYFSVVQLVVVQIILAVVLSGHSLNAAAIELAGKITLLKGVVTAEGKGQPFRSLAKGSEVFISDRIETSADSFLVMKMTDGGKITLRPNSIFEVVSYNANKGQEEEKFKLIKGGFRAVSGAIGHARPENVKMETRTTTIGIRGTDIVVYDCHDQDCSLLEKQLGNKSRIPPGRKGNNGGVSPIITVLAADTKRVLEREEVADIKNAVYFAVLEGKIFAQSGNERIDLEAIDACYRAGETPFDEDQDFHCLIEIPKFILFDEYLNVPQSEFTLFNAFREIGKDESQMCEVN